MGLHAIIEKVNLASRKPKTAVVGVGETVKVHYKIKEGNKERIQIFEGLVISVKKANSLQGSFTVRKVVAGIGVERIFPFHSPHLAKVERVKSGKVRRAKLNFVRRYALSRRFKLKDKGVEGSVWEEVAKEHAEIEKEVAHEHASAVATDEKVEEAETLTEDAANDSTEQTARNDGRESSDGAAEAEKTPDSKTEPSN